MRTLILASFVTPPFLGAFAWVLLGGPNAGLLNQWYYALIGAKPFEAAPLINIFSAWGMVFVMALYTFPYVFTFVTNSLETIPSELEEASAICGATPVRTAMNVTLPLAMPALLAGFLVAFLQSMTLFGTPAILALPAGVDTMTTKIWSLFQFRRSSGSPPPRRCRCCSSPWCCCARRRRSWAGAAIRSSAARAPACAS
jgi:iron(III) transport system permease protein